MKRALLAATMLTWAGGALAQTVTPGQGSLTDAAGHAWAITASGSITEDGQYAPGGGGTSELTIVDNQVYGKDSGHGPINPNGWFALSGSGQYWTVSTDPAGMAAPVSQILASSGQAPLGSAGEGGVSNGTPPDATTACETTGASTGGFHVSGGQIIGPDGMPWIARGINAYDSLIGEGAAMTGMFPGLNFVRVGIHSYQTPGVYQAFVTQMTNRGVVLEFENHPDGGGGQDSGPPGGIGAESAWYAAMAKAYSSNPYVWFGTFNEPKGISSLSSWQRATYDAIRGTGNNNIILVYSTGELGVLQPSVYASMHNIVWDVHYYGGGGGGNTDQALADSIAGSQSIQSADGLVPALIGEYGNSMDGTNIDSNGVAAVESVINRGGSRKNGSGAWAWKPGGNADHLQDGGALTSPYGEQVALYIGTDVVPPTPCQQAATAQNTLTQITAQVTAESPAVEPTQAEATPTQAADPSVQAQIDAADAAIAQANAILARINGQ